jgi:DtxR family Mn-dependent transcriptional regulator
MAESGTSNNRRRRARREAGEGQLTQAAENYLLSIFMVQEQGLSVTNANLVAQLKRTPESEGLGTSPPSVAGMIKRMSVDDLIGVSDSREIQLTSRGKTLAESIVRRHRLAERMIVDLLGLGLADAHVEAHRLEHAISDVLEEQIKIALGNPVTCPFGHPIPGSAYEPPKGGSIAIGSASAGAKYEVDMIPEEDQELLVYLVESGIVPGATLLVRENAPYRGVLTLEISGRHAAMGLEVADRVFVHKI